MRWLAVLLLLPALAFGQTPESATLTIDGTGAATLSWTPPTENTDGTQLTDLAGYNIYWGTTEGTYTNEINIANPTITTYVVEALAPGTYYFVATAYNESGVESSFSNVATKNITGPPQPPGALTVSGDNVFQVLHQQDGFLLLVVGTVPAGTECNPNQRINGRYVVPVDQVQWSAGTTARPNVVVADCL